MSQMVQDVKTRWNSSHDMLEMFLEKSVKFTKSLWKLMEKAVKVKEAMLKLSSAYACISQSIPTITSILHALKPSNLITDHGLEKEVEGKPEQKAGLYYIK
jgi:hypothetical protein